MRSGSRVGLALLLIGGPVLALVALDRAVVHWDAHWAWAAREVPTQVLDPYRVEALLRSTPAGRQNVVLLGNSVADEAFDTAALETRFRERGLRFPKLIVAGSPAAEFGVLAGSVAALQARTAVYVVSPPGLRNRDFLTQVYGYDVAAVPELFSAAEVLSEPRFHLEGLIGQLHVFARHRRALQRAALVWLGRLSWERLALEGQRTMLLNLREGRDNWANWMRDREPDVYPNPNTRALGHLARRLAESGTSLLVVQAPIHPTQMKLGIRKRVARYRSYLRELAAAEGFTLLAEDRVPQLDDYEFQDWVHANERGRERLTAFLGDYVEENL